jgi:hypothetical protein
MTAGCCLLCWRNGGEQSLRVDVSFTPASEGGCRAEEALAVARLFLSYVQVKRRRSHPGIKVAISASDLTAPPDRCLTVRVYANQSGRGCRLERISDLDPRRDVNVELSQGTGSNIVAPERIVTYHYAEGAMEGPETEQCFATLLVLAAMLLERAVALS